MFRAEFAGLSELPERSCLYGICTRRGVFESIE